LAAEPTGIDAWQEIAAWRVPMPKAKVLSGAELEAGGVRCALFGVRIPPSTAADVLEFLEAYIKACGRYFSISCE